jgi:ABC-2 type transport system ATP-binding protein
MIIFLRHDQNVQRNENSADYRQEASAVIRVSNLRKTYQGGDGEVVAVDDVSFSIERGSLVGLLGPNGAGKTTVIKSILGIVLPDSGEVEVNGIDVHENQRQAYRHVGAVLEGARNIYWRLTVRENLEFFARLAGLDPSAHSAYHEELLEKLNLTDRADSVVNELSRGMKQKVSLAAVLARKPDVVFLDEPTLGLDVESSLDLREELSRLVEDEEMTVVLSSHDMDVIEELCERVVILNEGEVLVDDAVENLVDGFRSETVRLTITGGDRDRTRTELDREYTIKNWSAVGEQVRFDVRLPDGNDLGPLVNELDEQGHQVVSVETQEPDFEEAFLRLTGSHTEGGDADSQRERASPSEVTIRE